VLHDSREGSLATFMKRAVSNLVSNSSNSNVNAPDIESVECWSYKNTALAAQTYMLAATSHGLATCAMEGYDSRKAREVLRIPDRYGLPLMVATGYDIDIDKNDNELTEEEKKQRSRSTPRLGIDEIVFVDSFGSSMK